MKNLVLLLVAVSIFNCKIYSQCSIFTACDGDIVLVGNNEDYEPILKNIWITPSFNGKYGTILFGFDQGYNNYEGGVNDKGLFVDAAAIPQTGWVSDPNKETITIDVVFNKFLENCKDLSDVRKLVEKYNIESLKRAQFLFVDTNGQSGVMLWHNNKQMLVMREKKYQVITNSHLMVKQDTYSSDVRSLIAERMLENPENYSIEGFKKILFSIHVNHTAYSNIYDLKNMKIYLFNYRNFLEPYIIDIKSIFSKGKQTIAFSEIFTNKSYIEKIFYSNVLINEMVVSIQNKGVQAVLNELNDLEKKYSILYGLSGENINTLGYRLLNRNMIKEAIEVFIFNTEKYPSNANVWDSLAEAYKKLGETELSIKYYEKSLELDQNNQNAIENIKELKKEK
jgi:tetratricopeptide (TPR) repeat protein